MNLRKRSYNGRTIDHDPRWDDFQTFLADMGEPAFGQTLDRIDNYRGYFKDNCRWATALQQVRNRTNTLKIDGVPFAQIAEDAGVGYDSLYYRVFTKGLTVEDAVAHIKADTVTSAVAHIVKSKVWGTSRLVA